MTLLAGQIRTSSGMVERPPPPPPRSAMAQDVAPPDLMRSGEKLLAALRRLALAGEVLPGIRDLAALAGVSRYVAAYQIEVLSRRGDIVTMSGGRHGWWGARALRLPPAPGASGGPVLRNAVCPRWWTP
jgi:hypothetical protein